MKKQIIYYAILILLKSVCFSYSIYAAEQPRAEQKSENAPFGMHGAFSRPFIKSDNVTHEEVLKRIHEDKTLYRHVQDIGIKWIRPGADIYWRAVQPSLEYVKKGRYDWRSIDDLYGRVPAGVCILGTFDPLVWGINSDPAFKPGTWEFASAEEEKYYIKFVKEVVERYDGDGYKDMPGLQNPIRYWQIGNEQAFRPLIGTRKVNEPLDWKGFSHIVEISAKAIKESDPMAKIALGGLASGYPLLNDPIAKLMDSPPGIREREEFYAPLLKDLNGKYIDIFDIHYYGSLQETSSEGWNWIFMKDVYTYIRQILNKNGYQNTEIWFTETAVPSEPSGERFQAMNLVKRFIYPLSFGVKKVFWWNMVEGEYPLEVDKPANHFGLVYDGLGQGDPGYGVKKLAYYTYKIMVEVLAGSDWNKIETIHEKDGIYVFKITKQGKSVWVAWNENKVPSQFSVTGLKASKIKVTKTIPKANRGRELKEQDYPQFFEEEFIAVLKGKADINLTDVPLFIKEIE
ncbi:MAG: hypothetical protein PHV60_02265 [bacterium]|nr:hypothetical protein [bacterium]